MFGKTASIYLQAIILFEATILFQVNGNVIKRFDSSLILGTTCLQVCKPIYEICQSTAIDLSDTFHCLSEEMKCKDKFCAKIKKKVRRKDSTGVRNRFNVRNLFGVRNWFDDLTNSMLDRYDFVGKKLLNPDNIDLYGSIQMDITGWNKDMKNILH